MFMVDANGRGVIYLTAVEEKFMLIKRNVYLEKLVNARHDGFVKIITGIRRCGKSWLLSRIYRRHLLSDGVPASRIVQVDLDDDRNEKLRNPRKLSEWIRRRVKNRSVWHYVFIDEIQMCEEVDVEVEGAKTKLTFYDVLNGLLKYPKLDVYVTGSNSKTLSSDIATNFRDRGEEIRMHPLSFAEFRSVTKKDEYAAFREYMLYGGMPLCVLKRTDHEKRAYLESLFSKVYLKDVIERNKVRDTAVLENILNVLGSSVGSLTNPTKLANQLNSQCGLKTNTPTVQRQIGYVKDAFLFSEAQRYDVRGKRYLDYPLKYYAEDVGLRNCRLNFREFEEQYLMENIVYNELISRGYAVDVGVVDVDVKENGKTVRKQCEIDFVVNTGFNKIYIQSAFSLAGEGKREQETLSLRKTGDFFRKFVVSSENSPLIEGADGISYVGVIPFLLDRNILDHAVVEAQNNTRR